MVTPRMVIGARNRGVTMGEMRIPEVELAHGHLMGQVLVVGGEEEAWRRSVLSWK